MVKTCSIFSCFGVFVFVSMLSPAQTAPATASSEQQLGTLESAVNFCTKVIPNSASVYKQWDEAFIKGQSTATLAEVRASAPYVAAYNKNSKMLQGLDAKRASATCSLQ